MDSGLTDTHLLTQSFVSQTPVTLQVEERALWGRSASSLGTDGGIAESPGPGFHADSTICLLCDHGQGYPLSEPQFSHLQNEPTLAGGVGGRNIVRSQGMAVVCGACLSGSS